MHGQEKCTCLYGSWIHQILVKPVALQLYFWKEPLRNLFLPLYLYFSLSLRSALVFFCLWGVSFPLSLSLRLARLHLGTWSLLATSACGSQIQFDHTALLGGWCHHYTGGWCHGTRQGNFDHHLWLVPLVPPDQGTSRTAPSSAISRVFQQKDFDTQIWIINWFNEGYFHQWNCHICVIRQMPRSKLICSGKSSPISSPPSSPSSLSTSLLSPQRAPPSLLSENLEKVFERNLVGLRIYGRPLHIF